MPEFLDQLRQEHRDLEKLIGVLERQMVAMARGKFPNFNVLQGVLRYMENYPGLLHHPKEDLVYDRLKQRDPVMAGGISGIVDEHYELEAMTRRIGRLLAARMQRGPMQGEGLEEIGYQFIGLYRRHIAVEESELFPRALEVLDAADWDDIAGRASPEIDPLFDGTVAAQYQALHHEIMRFAA